MFSTTSVTNSYKKSQVFGPWRTSHHHFLGLLKCQNTAEESVKEIMSVKVLLKCQIQDLTSGLLMDCIRFSISAQATVCWMHPDVQAELSRHHAAVSSPSAVGNRSASGRKLQDYLSYLLPCSLVCKMEGADLPFGFFCLSGLTSLTGDQIS